MKKLIAVLTLIAMMMTGTTLGAFAEEMTTAETYVEENEVYTEEEIEEVVEVSAVDADVPVNEIDATLGGEEAETPYVEVIAEGEGTIIEDENATTNDNLIFEDENLTFEDNTVIEDNTVVEDNTVTEEENSEASIDMSVLEQIVNDTIDAYMEEGQEAVIAALRANLGDAVPNGLLTEVVARLLAERYDEVPSAEALSEAMAPQTEDAQAADTQDSENAAQAEESEEDADAIEAEAVDEQTEEITEVDADLSELDGEAAEETAEDDPEARRQQMEELINNTIANKRTEGIYAALDDTFATLAENATELANPETGVIETDGNAIINMTYDALQANFDASAEQLMGAIGAAAMRADDAGYLQSLGGDVNLVSMAAEEGSAESTAKAAVSFVKDEVDVVMGYLEDVHPAMKLVTPMMKMMLGAAFDAEEEQDPNEVILEKLNDMEGKLDDMKADMEKHTENVVTLNSLGGETGTVAKCAQVLRNRVSNIQSNSALSREEKLSQIAALYGQAIVTDLETAMVGATNAFQGKHSYTLGNESIFDAAYNKACENVMFSGEALDATSVYIARQLGYYAEGYAVLEQVYEAYEAVYGASSLTATRREMKENLTGSESPFTLCKRYFQQYRKVFVNKSNTTRIKLSSYIRVECDLGESVRTKTSYRNIPKTSPAYMTKNPLSAAQVKALASYCADKDMTLFEFLFNKMQFTPYIYSDTGFRLCPFYTDSSRSSGFNHYVLPESSLIVKNRVFLATGAQSYTRDSATIRFKGELIGGYMQAINMTKAGASDEKIKFFDNKSKDNNYRATVAFFEKY